MKASPFALALGSDGRLYAPVQDVARDKLKGRPRIELYQLTPAEERLVKKEILLIAPNVTVGIPRKKRRRSS